MKPSEKNKKIAEQVIVMIQALLPTGWQIKERKSRRSEAAPVLLVRAPDGREGSLDLVVRKNLNPRGVLELKGIYGAERDRQMLVVTGYLSKATIAGLESAGFGYADLTGNVSLALDSPAVFVKTIGAEKNPDPPSAPVRSLKGPRVGRVVRALLDFAEPYGASKLAELACVDQGYVSRILERLYQEAMIERQDRGPVSKVYREKLLRKWAEDAPYDSRGKNGTFFSPAGLEGLETSLKQANFQYAATGSYAASRVRFIAPPAFAMLYVPDLQEAADRLNLVEVTEGANVILVKPKDDFVFERTVEKSGLILAASSQIAADLLTSPGRGPTIADEFIEWLKRDEDSWHE